MERDRAILYAVLEYLIRKGKLEEFEPEERNPEELEQRLFGHCGGRVNDLRAKCAGALYGKALVIEYPASDIKRITGAKTSIPIPKLEQYARELGEIPFTERNANLTRMTELLGVPKDKFMKRHYQYGLYTESS